MYVMKRTEKECSHQKFCVKLNLKKCKSNYGMNSAEFMCSFSMTETELFREKQDLLNTLKCCHSASTFNSITVLVHLDLHS